MNIIVCIKQVPNTTDVKIDPVTNTLIRDGVESVINPFDTYAIEEAAGSGNIGLYGAAAHLGKPGDLVIILSYGLIDNTEAKGIKLITIKVDNKNKIKKTK